MSSFYFPSWPEIIPFIFFYGCVLYVGLKILCAIFSSLHGILWPYVLGRPKDLHLLAGTSWAVITGSTDGIGKAYSFELAARGFSLFLVARNSEKLSATKQEIIAKYPGADVKTITFDFSTANVEDYERKLFGTLDNFPIGVLINNVGATYDYPDRIDKVAGGAKMLTDVFVVNGLPVTLLSARVLDQMFSRNRGIIVNVSSSAGFHPLCYWGVYSSIKEYMRYLGACMRKEYGISRIVIQTLCPMLVVTKMSDPVRNADFPACLSVSPEKFAKQAIRSIGLVDETTGCISHQIQYVLSRLIPNWLMDIMIRRNGEKIRRINLEKLKQGRPGPSSSSSGQLLLRAA
ncbi:17beta-hydroxysteroid dehydrogenase [Aphelenchoides bicaudatus]|nr:17beta-hydroxysteroid dehydrogenase [Aphelenchoides bicaudatus]